MKRGDRVRVIASHRAVSFYEGSTRAKILCNPTTEITVAAVGVDTIRVTFTNGNEFYRPVHSVVLPRSYFGPTCIWERL
jgi:kynurenine formamidase